MLVNERAGGEHSGNFQATFSTINLGASISNVWGVLGLAVQSSCKYWNVIFSKKIIAYNTILLIKLMKTRF